MTYESFFAGVGAVTFGALLGSWVSCRLTYEFQQKLLKQQLDFQREQSEKDAAQRKEIHDETLAAFREFRNMLNWKAGKIASELSNLPKWPKE
jgi:hypothetical protein